MASVLKAIDSSIVDEVVLPIVGSITIDKQKLLHPDDFAGHIRTLAKSDAVHDIHETTNWFKQNNTFTRIFNASILQNLEDNNHPIEDVGFMSIMETNTGTRQEFLDTITITDSVSAAAAATVTFNVGHRNSDYNGIFTQLHSYNGYAVSVKMTAPKNTHTPAENFAENFSQVTGLHDFALIVDFNTHDFLDSFKHGMAAAVNIYYVLTPEVVNDPAPKTSMQNSMFGNTVDAAGATLGGTMIPLYQVDNNSTFYSRYDNNNNAYNNNFMSAYDFKLSKLTRVITKKVESFTTDLTITTIHKSQPYTAFIVNGKHENSNKTITGLLRSLISSMMTSTSFQHEFDITTKYQQKRLGDWGQCLACLDLNNRNFMKYIEKSPSTETDQLIKDIPKLIVSHDKLCVTYALLMGANVIYLDYYGIAYIFLNTQDSTVATTIPYPRLLYNTIQRLYQRTGSVNPTYPMYYILKFANIYSIARQHALSTKYSAILEKIGKITGVYSNDVPDLINVEYIEGLILQFRELFRLCVELKYMEMYLIDVDDDIPKFGKKLLDKINIGPFEVTGTIDEFYAANSFYNNANDAIYIELYKAYNRLNGVYTQHNSTNYDVATDTPTNIISDTWLNIVKKLDVWKSADNLFKTETTIQKTTKYDIRLLNYNNSVEGGEIRINDSFMFLPYIQQINAVMRVKIMELIDTIIVPNIVIPYYSQLVIKPTTAGGFMAGAMRVFRNGAQPQDQKYFNQLVDLVYQSRVFLPPTPDEYTQDQIILSKIMTEKASTVVVSSVAAASSSPPSYDNTMLASVKPLYILKFKECIQKVIDRNKANKAEADATDAAADAASYAFYEDIDYNYLELIRQEVEQETREIEEFYSDLGSWALICSGINSQHINGRTDGLETPTTTGPNITTIERPNTTITSDDAITYADFGGIMILEQNKLFSNKTKNESDIQTDYADDETGDILPDDIETVPIANFNPHNIQFGGHRFYIDDTTITGYNPKITATRKKMTSNTICDMSIKQTTYPLLIHYLFNKYKSPITFSVVEAMTRPDLTNKIIDKIDSLLKKEQTPPSLEEVQARTDDVSSVQAQSGEVSSVQAQSGEVSPERLDQIYNIKGGKSPINLLENRELGFHPLLPLYMVLQPFYFVISDNLVKSCFYDANLKYIKVIEKMCTELIKVINTSHQDALIIGFGLRTFIFTATRINNEEPLTLARYRKMLEIIDMTESEYRSMCNKWDIFVNTYGIIRETQEEIIEGNTYLESPIFKEFITNKVNIKQIIGTEPETYTEVELNGKVIQLLTLIVDKIWSDRNPNMIEPVQAQVNQENFVEPEKLEHVVQKKHNLIYLQPSRFKPQVNPSRKRGQGKTRRKKNAKKTMLLNNIKKLRRLEKTIKRLKKETHKQKKRNPKKKTVKFDKESENKESENKESENKESENKEFENKEYIL